jgi:hypothetical protein
MGREDDQRGTWLRSLSRERRALIDAEWVAWLLGLMDGNSDAMDSAEAELRKLIPSVPSHTAPGTVLSLLQRLHR